MLKYIPGLVGAIAAYLGLKFISWIAGLSFGVQIVVFLVIYFVVAFFVDKAMSQYGGGSLKSD